MIKNIVNTNQKRETGIKKMKNKVVKNSRESLTVIANRRVNRGGDASSQPVQGKLGQFNKLRRLPWWLLPSGDRGSRLRLSSLSCYGWDWCRRTRSVKGRFHYSYKKRPLQKFVKERLFTLPTIYSMFSVHFGGSGKSKVGTRVVGRISPYAFVQAQVGWFKAMGRLIGRSRKSTGLFRRSRRLRRFIYRQGLTVSFILSCRWWIRGGNASTYINTSISSNKRGNKGNSNKKLYLVHPLKVAMDRLNSRRKVRNIATKIRRWKNYFSGRHYNLVQERIKKTVPSLMVECGIRGVMFNSLEKFGGGKYYYFYPTQQLSSNSDTTLFLKKIRFKKLLSCSAYRTSNLFRGLIGQRFDLAKLRKINFTIAGLLRSVKCMRNVTNYFFKTRYTITTMCNRLRRLMKRLDENKRDFKYHFKSNAVMRFLYRYFYTFRVQRNHTRVTRRSPFRLDLNPRSFYFRFLQRKKTRSYRSYNNLRLFFGAMKPSKFWQYSRKIHLLTAAGSIQHQFGHLDLRLDNILVRLGLTDDIFASKNALERGEFTVSGRVVSTNDYLIKPFQWISPLEERRAWWRELFFIRLVEQRVRFSRILPLPRFVEFNVALFRFMILPFISHGDFFRPFRIKSRHVGLGRTMPSQI